MSAAEGSRYLPLCDGEDNERDATAEEGAGNDIREPVDLQVRAAPGHSDDAEDGKRPPPPAARTGGGEEQDERDAGRAGVGDVARREGGADGMDEPVRRASAINQHLEERREKRRQRLRDGERDESEPATSAKEEQSDDREREGTADPAAEPVEDEGEVGEQRRLEVPHRLGPAAVEGKWSCRDEKGEEYDEPEHSAAEPESPGQMLEELFAEPA